MLVSLGLFPLFSCVLKILSIKKKKKRSELGDIRWWRCKRIGYMERNRMAFNFYYMMMMTIIIL